MVDENTQYQNAGPYGSASISQTEEAARSAVEHAQESARDLGNRAAEETKQGLHTVGERIRSMAESIRQAAPEGGRVGSAAHAVADTLKSGGDYLAQRGVSDIASDVREVVRRYPMQSFWIGIGLGVLLGAAVSRR